MSEVKLISHTLGAGELEGKSPQDVISYVARVSNPHNQESYHTAGGLLKYCIKHHHWSIFETASMTLEINTTRGIAAQILRHRSFTFQEFSQRYASTELLDKEIRIPELRRQDTKNRQNSTSDLPPGLVKEYRE
jgi:thymidylate synthase (FAD)